jgi:sodium transport system permease protein
LQTLVAASAKGFREAQATLTYVVLVPMVPAMVQIIVQPEPRTSVMWIPAFAEQIIIDQWLRNQAVAPGLLALTVGSTSAVALLLAWSVSRRYGDERTFLP